MYDCFASMHMSDCRKPRLSHLSCCPFALTSSFTLRCRVLLTRVRCWGLNPKSCSHTRAPHRVNVPIHNPSRKPSSCATHVLIASKCTHPHSHQGLFQREPPLFLIPDKVRPSVPCFYHTSRCASRQNHFFRVTKRESECDYVFPGKELYVCMLCGYVCMYVCICAQCQTECRGDGRMRNGSARLRAPSQTPDRSCF
jgi:hypothetical protein